MAIQAKTSSRKEGWVESDRFELIVNHYSRRRKISRKDAVKEIRGFYSGFNRSLSVGEQIEIPDYFWRSDSCSNQTKWLVIKKVGRNHLRASIR